MEPHNITFRGGLRAGAFNVSWPFVTLRLAQDSVVIEAADQRHFLKKEEVTKLELHSGVFSKGVRIYHANQGLDQPTIFWTFAPRSILVLAENLGFEVPSSAP